MIFIKQSTTAQVISPARLCSPSLFMTDELWRSSGRAFFVGQVLRSLPCYTAKANLSGSKPYLQDGKENLHYNLSIKHDTPRI